MLQKIRDRSQGWITWVIVGFICFTFALWGIHNFMGTGEVIDEVANVNGVPISKSAFANHYESLREQQSLLNQNTLPEVLAQQLKVVALEQLILAEVLVQGANAEGFAVTDKQAQVSVMSFPAFQENGQFSEQRFTQFLNQFPANYQMLVQQVGQQMLIDQVSFGLKATSFALPFEVDKLIELQDERRDFTYLELPIAAQQSTIAVTDAQLQQYYDAHKDDFKSPEQVRLDYIELSLPALTVQKDPQTGSERSPEQQFAELSDKLASLTYENPDSLSPAAEALKLPIKSTDYIERSGTATGITANSALLQAVFSPEVLQQKYNSQVITIDPQTQVVVRVNNIKPAAYRSLDEVKDTVRQAVQQQAAHAAVKQQAESMLAELRQGKSLPTLAQQHALTSKTLTNIAVSDNTVDKAILNYVFTLSRSSTATPTVGSLALPSGDYVLVSLSDIRAGNPQQATPDERKNAEAKWIEFTGDVDYQNYIESLMHKADIER